MTIKDCFLSLLDKDLKSRKERNNDYSLRSFAKYLRVDPSTLSQILRKKRKPTEKFIKIILPLLEIGLATTEELSVIKSFDPSLIKRSLFDLRLSEFEVISDCDHDVVFEMINLKNFQSDTSWISQKSGISKAKVALVIQNLIKIGLVCEDEEGRLKANHLGTQILTDLPFSTDAQKSYQKQILQRAQRSIDSTPKAQRKNTSVMMPISSSKIEEAKSMINEFLREFNRVMAAGADAPDEVYQVAVSFFPMTENNVKEELPNGIDKASG